MAEDLKLFVWGNRRGEVKAFAMAPNVHEARRYIRADKENTDFMEISYIDEEPEVFEGITAFVTNEQPVDDTGFTVIHYEGEGTPHADDEA